MPKRRQPVYTLQQERLIKKIANKVFKERFKDKKLKEPQVKLGLALGDMSQSSVSAMLAGTYTPAPHFTENLATLAGYESLKEMIGPFAHPVSDEEEDVPESSKSASFPNLRKCTDFHASARWHPWTIAAAKAGYFTEDVAPDEWVKRLDSLEKSFAKAK